MQFTHVLVIMLVVISGLETALNVSDEGVCVRNVTKKKLNKYGKQVVHKFTKAYCCPNWKYSEAIDGCIKTIEDPPIDVPTCKDPCVNGKCIKNDVCECDAGLKPLNNTHCAPACPLHFINDLHTLNCTCDRGYTLDPADDSNCLPYCDKGCENGVCIAPDKCECPSDYDLINDSKCKPRCTNCENGECKSPNNCMCNEGYVMNNDTCTPVCDNECINAVCMSPNGCECNNGYRKNSTALHICYKPCSTLCNYGTCNLEGQCICELGWELDGDTCKAVMPEEVNEPTGLTSQTTLAGLELSWVLSGVVIMLLVAIVVIIMQRIWQKRKKIERKAPVDCNAYGSVVYTVPNTLTRRSDDGNVANEELNNDNACDTTSEYENVENEAQVRERLFKIGNQI